MASVQREDVREWAQESSPVVHVEGVEQGREEDSSSAAPLSVSSKDNQPSEGKAHVHDAENIKTSYDVEEDVSPSLLQKLKGRFLGLDSNLRPESQEEMQTKNTDSHPDPSSIWSKKPESISLKDALPESRAPSEVENPVQRFPQPEAKKQVGSEELGTGYEEDSEQGAFSSEGSTDLSEKEASKPQPESLFKPVNAKDESETTLEDLRASKLKDHSSADNVKAPGVLDRAKEEVEAVADQIQEGLNLKERRGNSGDENAAVNQGGFFSRIAEKIGYHNGAHGRSQSH